MLSNHKPALCCPAITVIILAHPGNLYQDKVPAAAQAILDWTLQQEGNEGVRSVNAVVGETNDGYLNNIPVGRELDQYYLRNELQGVQTIQRYCSLLMELAIACKIKSRLLHLRF